MVRNCCEDCMENQNTIDAFKLEANIKLYDSLEKKADFICTSGGYEGDKLDVDQAGIKYRDYFKVIGSSSDSSSSSSSSSSGSSSSSSSSSGSSDINGDQSDSPGV